MFHLSVQSPNINDFSVVLVKSTQQSYSVICGLWPAMGGLPTVIDIALNLYAYASTYTGEFIDGLTISPNELSSPLSEGNVYLFTGTNFVQEGQTPSDFDYGLRNGHPSSLTCGLCQEITLNGQVSRPPVCVQRLLTGFTAYFPANNQFWLGLGRFLGLSDPEPGLLISTSMIEEKSTEKESISLEPAVGKFSLVDFSLSTSMVATYQPNSGSFQIEPSQSHTLPASSMP